MKKRIVNLVLFGAVVVASASMFNSCKDYDDDIADLRNSLTSESSTLTALIEEKTTTLTSLVSSLQTQANNLESAYQLADEALQTAIDNAAANAATDAQTKADAAEAAAKSYADIQAEAARVAAIAAAEAALDEAVDDLQSQIDAANGLIAKNSANIDSLLAADVVLTQAVATAQARADEAYELAEDAMEMASKNASDIEELQTKLQTVTDNLSQAMDDIKDLQDAVSILETDVTALQDSAAIHYAQIVALEAELTSLKESNEKAHEALAAKDAELEELIEANNEAINERLDNEVATLREEAEANLALAYTYSEELTAIVQGEIDDINTTLEELAAAYQAADEELQEQIDALAARVEAVETSITELQASIKEINEYLVLETKRLKGLVFAPQTYVDGIESIVFSTLYYVDWGTDESLWLADKPTGPVYQYIDDAQHEEEWLVNPKNATLSEITDLSFVWNTATNISTRSVSSENAPIVVTKMPTEIKDGVMTLKLKKTNRDEQLSDPDDNDNFTIVALKATLDNNLLTEEEIENGEAEVYSDWARLYEQSIRALIHNTTAWTQAGKPKEDATRTITVTDSNGDTSTETEYYSHFWCFSEVYTNEANETGLDVKFETSFNSRYIAKEVCYEDEIDLYDLVTVCGNDGNEYDAEAYGLTFEFNLMPYWLLNEGETSDATDQSSFARLTEGHILTSTAEAEDGTEKNRAAIGREPMIQVVLKDTSDPKNVKVVDVRYFKIKWIDEEDISTYGSVGSYKDDYVCCDNINVTVPETELNAIYAKYNMSRSQFHNSYTLVADLFETEEEAIAGTPVASTLGSIADMTDGTGSGQTHNLMWTFSTCDNHFTKEEYEAGYKEITAWGYFQSITTEGTKIVFSITVKLDITQMAYADNIVYNTVYWMTDGELRWFNPQLEDDGTYGKPNYETTMLIGNILKGYLAQTDDVSRVPSTVIDLMNETTDDAVFVFDGSGLSALAEATGTKVKDWTLSDDGLTLYYQNEKAAIIDNTSGSLIQLVESDNGSAKSEPTEGAKLLVGQDIAIKLTGKYCDFTHDLDKYDVLFMTPLKLASTSTTLSVTDIMGGGSSVSLANTIQIEEASSSNQRVVWNNYYPKQTAVEDLISWYGVDIENILFDTDNAKTNYTDYGISSGYDRLLSSFLNDDGSQMFNVKVSDGNTNGAKITFYNNSGNAIAKSISIQIPFVIETKWQTLTGTIYLTVNKGTSVD